MAATSDSTIADAASSASPNRPASLTDPFPPTVIPTARRMRNLHIFKHFRDSESFKIAGILIA
jgi:hypothetical protein